MGCKLKEMRKLKLAEMLEVGIMGELFLFKCVFGFLDSSPVSVCMYVVVGRCFPHNTKQFLDTSRVSKNSTQF